MLEINYTADDARNDAIEYNNSLDKAVLCAENAIVQAAQKGILWLFAHEVCH